MTSISISDLRKDLKGVLAQVAEGDPIYVTSRGDIIAVIHPYSNDQKQAYNQRIKAYQSSVQIIGDIVDAPLMDEDFLYDIDDQDDTNKAAEPEA